MKLKLLFAFTVPFALILSCGAQTILTTPGNGASIRARMFYTDGRPCTSCTLRWTQPPSTAANVAAGYHYHSATGAPLGTFLHADIATDANGYANASWSSETATDNGDPVGYAMQYNVGACAPQATNYCDFITIRTLYAGLSQAAISKGWVKTGDTAHHSLQYAADFFFQSALNSIASKYYTLSKGHPFMVVRISLPFGGIYDGWLTGGYWRPSYTGPNAGEEHMYGDEADISLSGLLTTDVENLVLAVSSTTGFDGRTPCEYWSGGYGLMHIYCGGN